jgi:glycosyltransferase involved in cell wall biosynthesis
MRCPRRSGRTGRQRAILAAPAWPVEGPARASRSPRARRGGGTSYELISVILPVYRQADHIAEVVHGYVEALGKVPVPHEMLLVVNGSDDSLAVCRALEDEHPTARVIENEEPGWGPAVRRGLREARGDLLCYTNSARTSAEDLVLMLLYAIAYPGVVIKATRRIRDSWFRRLGSLVYNLECRVLFDLANFDLNATPKVFPRSFEPLVGLRREDDLIDVEFNVVCRRAGYRMIEVPIFATSRHGGRSTTTIWSAIRMYYGAIQLWRSMRGPARGR